MPRISNRNVGGSLAFNGSTSFVNITNTSGQIFNNQNYFTVSMNVKIRAYTTGYIFAHQSTATANRIYISLTPTGIVNLQMSNAGAGVATPNPLKIGQWYNIVAVYDRVTPALYLYINGALVASLATGISAPGVGLVDLQIGSRIAGAEPTNILVDDVKFFASSVARPTDTEVAYLYFNNVNLPGFIDGLALDTMTGTTAVSTTGNNNGTITAGTWSTDRPFANSNSVQDIKASASGDSTSPVGSIDTTTSGAGTVMMWLKTASQTGVTVFGLVGADGITDAWRFNCSSTYPFIWTTNTSGSGTGIFNSNSTFPNKIWTHVACTLTTDGVNTNGKIYINGQLIISSTLARDVRSVSRLVVYNNPDYKTTDVVAYERELSQAEILSHYNTSATPTIPKIKWERTEGVGNINYDTSGNLANSTGTLTWSSDTPSKSRKQVGGNMIPNGDFSYVPVVNVATTTSGKFINGTVAGGASNIFGWLFTKSGTASSVFDVNNTYLGNPSLKASLSATASYLELFTSGVNNNIISYFGKSFIRVLPSTSYTLRYAMKTNYVSGDSSSGAYITIIGSNGDGSSSSSQTNGTPIKTTTDWTIYTVTWTTSATTRYAQINPVIYGHTAAGTLIMDAWFANITLTPTVNTTRTQIT